MPQASLFVELNELPEFKNNAEMHNRASGDHAFGTYVINLQTDRHEAGRTYGRSNLKKQFFIKYNAESDKINLDPKITDKIKPKENLQFQCY